MKETFFPVILSSPSGGGKTTIKNELIKMSPVFGFSITCTTRPKREDEIDGKDYYFVSNEEFDKMIENDELLEWAYVHGYRYGTPKKSIMKLIDENKIPIMTIDVAGAMNIKKIFPNCVLIFILPPSVDDMIERLKKRGEDENNIHKRINTALKEIEYAEKFDYLVINDILEKTVEKICKIIKAERNKTSRNIRAIEDFKIQLKKFNPGGN